MNTATKTRLPKFCVYQHGWDQGYQDSAVGDGLVSPNRLLVATCETREEADALCESIGEKNRNNTGALVPGSNRRVAMLDVDSFDPLDFVPRQQRDNESSGTRYAALCGRLYADAAERRARLEEGNA